MAGESHDSKDAENEEGAADKAKKAAEKVKNTLEEDDEKQPVSGESLAEEMME